MSPGGAEGAADPRGEREPGRLRSLTRARIGLGLAALALLIGLALLIHGALGAAASEQGLRREALAARVFDELEASLAAIVAAEEARPFVQWRREWLARDGTTEGGRLIRSPLAELPEPAFVLGYFQIEPDGRFATPMDADDQRVELLRALSRELVDGERPAAIAAAPESEPVQRSPQAQAQAQRALPEDLQIQRALDQQAVARQRKQAVVEQGAFAPDLEQLSNFVNQAAQAELDLELPAVDALDVQVTGFTVEARGPYLRLSRVVSLAGSRWIQGLILDRAALERHLELEVLGGPELAGLVELDWRSTSAADPDAGRWTHRFAAPFSTLEVSVVLDPLSSLSSTSARLILALGLALALTLLAVSLAVDRTLAALLDRAQERERFIAAVTHELRTPLTSIRMYSEMLEAGMVPDAERQRSYHQTIRSEAERLSRLVEQVLTLARVEERGRESSRLAGERARLDTIVTGVVELLAPQAAARSLSVELELSEAAASVELPRDALAQILTNLLDNAIKFTPVAGEAVEIVATREAESLRVVVRDRGPGVDAALLSPMFQPFVRALREHERATPGTGIGLAVVAAVVAELGGGVQAHNREGGGLIIEVVI